jgi:tetratricopeptide (TPR) repeat protein
MMICIVLLTLTQFESEPIELYNLGNKYFEQGKYSEAIAAYERASQDLSNAKIFYNLGNAYFKKGMHGKAILNYRRARFISPRDGDISHNLDFVRSYRVDKISPSSSPIVRILANLFQYFSLFEAQILATLLFIISALLLSLYIVFRRKNLLYTAMAGMLFCLFFFVGWQIWAAERNGQQAVVVAPEVNAMSGPGDDYKEIIVLHDGAEIRVREKRGDYLLIQLPGGIGGWIPQDAVEYIFK